SEDVTEQTFWLSRSRLSGLPEGRVGLKGSGAPTNSRRKKQMTEAEARIDAANTFVRLHPEYPNDSQEAFDLMNSVIAQHKLDPSKVSHLEKAWGMVRQICSSVPLRPRQGTTHRNSNPPAQPIQTPQNSEDAALEAAARGLISSG